MKTLNELCSKFYNFSNMKSSEIDANEVNNLLSEIAQIPEGQDGYKKDETGITIIQKTVRNYYFDSFTLESRAYLIRTYVIPFCKENKINITKKYLKTL